MVTRGVRPDGLTSIRPGYGWADLPGKLPVTNVIPPSSVLLHRTDVPVFDQDLAVQEDWDAWLHLLSTGVSFACTETGTLGYVKDLVEADSSTVRAGREAAEMARFVSGYQRITQRYPAPSSAVAENRARWREIQRDWVRLLHAGRALVPSYYEDELARLFGQPHAEECCEFDFSGALGGQYQTPRE